MEPNKSTNGTVIQIYAIIDPVTKETKYVGKSRNVKSRLLQHYQYGNEPLCKWLKSMEPVMPQLAILETCHSKDDASVREKHWIAKLTNEGCTLFNTIHANKSRKSKVDTIQIHDLTGIATASSIKELIKKIKANQI